MTNSVSLIPREIREASYPKARFLSEHDQEFYENVASQYSDKARNTLNISKEGSNLFKVLLLTQKEYITATLPELELSVENGLPLRGNYEDSREVVLRSSGDSYEPNDLLAKDLAEKIKIKNFDNPVIVRGLMIIEDDRSDYGLVFEKTDKTEIIEAPDFHYKNNGRNFIRLNEDYSIDFDEEGKRTFYARDNGLSGRYLDRDLGLNSNYNNLANSISNGRVVLVSAQGASEFFLDEYVNKLRKERDKQFESIKEKYDKAESILRSK